ncbi:MAG: hypothetical protein RL462_1645 [Pseudomonadota bacterium]|jgi:hypothetical protein
MKDIKKLLIIGVAASLYYLSLWMNEMLWGETEFSFDVHWVFFPSGIRFILVLLALEFGAMGIAVGGMLWNFQDHPDLGMEFAFITGCVAGLSPWLARMLSVKFLHLDHEFKVVSPQTLLKISLLFATLSALLHQIWFYAQGLTENFAFSLGVMALSNWVGTLLVLMVFKLLIQGAAKSKSGLDS